jgi:hypothetical protein
MRSQVRLGIALVSLAVLSLGACETVPSQEYSPTAPKQAMLIHYDNKWRPIFDRIDLASGQSLPMESIRTNGIPETFDYNGKRVTPELKQQLGLESSSGRVSTGYRVTVWQPGDDAMVGIIQPNSNGTMSWVDTVCFTGAAPVFRLEAGMLNVFEAQKDIQARATAGPTYDPKIVEREEERVRFFVRDHPQLKGEVRLAPIVASVQYYKPQAPNPRALCDHADHFVAGPPRPLPPPQ